MRWQEVLPTHCLMIFTALFALTPLIAQPATCECKVGKVVPFDFAIQVPRPTQDAAAIMRWKSLFEAAPRFNFKVLEGAECVFRVDAGLFNADRQGGKLVFGGEYANAAPPGPIKTLDYIITGEVTSTGNSYTITARIEAAYSREVVKSVSITTPPGPDQIKAAAEALATRMGPFTQTITDFEKRKRTSDTKFSRSNPEGKIEITVKRRIIEGERTEVRLKMTDCDGYPLANREIRFTKGSWPDLGDMPGTTGGTAKPSSVVTDAAGQAAVSFKGTKAGEAELVAWYGHYRPTGHPYVLLKTTKITIDPFKVRPIFTLSFEEKLTSKESNYTIQVESGYALTAGPDGSIASDQEALSSEDLYRLRGGILGLKPGEKLNFYALEETASGIAYVEGRPCSAKHELSKEGRFQTWVNGAPETNEMKRSTMRGSERIQTGEVIEATLTRTPQGATLVYSPRTVMSSGCEFLTSPLFNYGFTASERKVGIGVFSLTESDLQNWGQVTKNKEGSLEPTQDRNLGSAVVTLRATFRGGAQ